MQLCFLRRKSNCTYSIVGVHSEKMTDEVSKYCVCYYADRNAKAIALSLLTFGHEIFAKTYHIQNLTELRQIVDSIPNSTKENVIKRLHPFIFENLIDAIKISVCFENYMKAKLMLNGFVVHRISQDEKYKSLKSEQPKRPILLDEVKNVCEWKKITNTDDYYLDALTTQTIHLNTLIAKPRYQKYIGLPSDINGIISEIVKKRNGLHFLTDESGNYGQSRIKELENLTEFMDTDFRILQNELVDALGESSDRKIKKRHANNE